MFEDNGTSLYRLWMMTFRKSKWFLRDTSSVQLILFHRYFYLLILSACCDSGLQSRKKFVNKMIDGKMTKMQRLLQYEFSRHKISYNVL